MTVQLTSEVLQKADLPHNLFTPPHVEHLGQAKAALDNTLEALAEFKQIPLSVVLNAMSDIEPNKVVKASKKKKVLPSPFAKAMALSVPAGLPENKEKVIEPWDDQPQYTILEALKEFSEKKFPKKILRIVHKENPVHTYKVKAYDPTSGRAQLEGGFKGGLLKPVITERESKIYYPQWI